ncbi:unnamed protein product, partial [marine sediment metagenome]
KTITAENGFETHVAQLHNIRSNDNHIYSSKRSFRE